ncbi:MAG: hypothetical protein ACLTSZ_01800 [Lachnospiraceae bacterium]
MNICLQKSNGEGRENGKLGEYSAAMAGLDDHGIPWRRRLWKGLSDRANGVRVQEEAALKIISRPADDQEIEAYYDNGYDAESMVATYTDELQRYVKEYQDDAGAARTVEHRELRRLCSRAA